MYFEVGNDESGLDKRMEESRIGDDPFGVGFCIVKRLKSEAKDISHEDLYGSFLDSLEGPFQRISKVNMCKSEKNKVDQEVFLRRYKSALAWGLGNHFGVFDEDEATAEAFVKDLLELCGPIEAVYCNMKDTYTVKKDKDGVEREFFSSSIGFRLLEENDSEYAYFLICEEYCALLGLFGGG